MAPELKSELLWPRNQKMEPWTDGAPDSQNQTPYHLELRECNLRLMGCLSYHLELSRWILGLDGPRNHNIRSHTSPWTQRMEPWTDGAPLTVKWDFQYHEKPVCKIRTPMTLKSADGALDWWRAPDANIRTPLSPWTQPGTDGAPLILRSNLLSIWTQRILPWTDGVPLTLKSELLYDPEHRGCHLRLMGSPWCSDQVTAPGTWPAFWRHCRN